MLEAKISHNVIAHASATAEDFFQEFGTWLDILETDWECEAWDVDKNSIYATLPDNRKDEINLDDYRDFHVETLVEETKRLYKKSFEIIEEDWSIEFEDWAEIEDPTANKFGHLATYDQKLLKKPYPVLKWLITDGIEYEQDEETGELIEVSSYSSDIDESMVLAILQERHPELVFEFSDWSAVNDIACRNSWKDDDGPSQAISTITVYPPLVVRTEKKPEKNGRKLAR